MINCLKLLTFVPMEEIFELAQLKDQQINEAKIRLAFEVTKLIHGEEEATKAKNAAESIFEKGASSDSMPTTVIPIGEFKQGINIIELFMKASLISSKGEGRRLIKQGGMYLNDVRIEEFDKIINIDSLDKNELILRKKDIP